MRKIFATVVLYIITFTITLAQGGGMPDTAMINRLPKIGKVMGSVIDSSNRKAVDYASVALLRAMDSSVVSGVVTGEKGEFAMEALPMGRFILVITSVGYKKHFSKPFIIMPRNTEINLGNILISPSSKVIKEVEVSADKQALLNTIDKRVIDVGKSIINTGGTATEVLQNVPGVTVDIDGNVSLRGNANVTVLIDGKPSGITGSSRAAILQQLPAGSIDRIEIITNPGARYDADGMAGIINIITKKDKMKGFNTNFSLGVGTHDKYNASFGINYRIKHLNLYANYNYRSEARWSDGHTERRNDYSVNGKDTVYFNNSVFENLNNSFINVAKIGTDWYINNNTTLGISAILNARIENNTGNFDYIFNDANSETFAKTYRSTSSHDKNISTDYSMDFKHTYKKKQELTASGTYSLSNRNINSTYLNYNKNIFDNTLGSLYLNQYNTTDVNFKVLTAQADFSNPVGENRKFETGIKTTDRFIFNNFDAFNFNSLQNLYENDSLLTQHYSYEEHIHAAYFQYSGIYKKITYQLGMRGEIAMLSGKALLTNTPFSFQYPGLYPSALAKYTYKKTNDFQVSYSRRVNRPGINTLLPIKNYEDQYNYNTGNPELKPENINSFEFSYYKSLKRNTIGTTLFYRHTLSLITRVRTLDTLTGIATTTFMNYSTSDNTGLEIIIKNTIRKTIQITSNINLFQNKVNGTNVEASFQSTSFNWNARTMIAGRVNKAVSFQLSGMYMAPTKYPQGQFRGMSGMEIGGKYDFWGTKASLTLNISDVLNTRHFDLYNFGPGFTSNINRKRESRVAMLSFSYRFGNAEVQQRKKKQEQGNEPRMDDF